MDLYLPIKNFKLRNLHFFTYSLDVYCTECSSAHSNNLKLVNTEKKQKHVHTTTVTTTTTAAAATATATYIIPVVMFVSQSSEVRLNLVDKCLLLIL